MTDEFHGVLEFVCKTF